MSDNHSLLAFVGEKISVDYFNPYEGTDQIPFDAGFKCKYKVMQWVYGKLPEDTIEFEAYTHRGSLFFDDYQNVLLFVSKSDDKLYHEKYQFFPVYRTKNGRWASCGDPYLSDSRVGKGVPVLKLEFDSPPAFNFKVLSEKYSPEYVGAVFMEPWFNCHTDSATCNMGAYVEDLFRVKRDGVLMARELFHVLPDTSSRKPNQ